MSFFATNAWSARARETGDRHLLPGSGVGGGWTAARTHVQACTSISTGGLLGSGGLDEARTIRGWVVPGGPPAR
ncbi:hypothetical protein [Asanoa siamensis]|uniref:Uncharacterized protein n=1 Tax=Asanoa siamensis TaxID=926357 RepID=A0ABQ4D2Q5_9ACTN|nr:hypothetical protein [Asanoa siamensis]GIF77558.1 hypothetical protein Asi02nite_70760 [Asanoa siamensis]